MAQGMYFSDAQSIGTGRPLSFTLKFVLDPSSISTISTNIHLYRLNRGSWQRKLARIGSRQRAFQQAIDEPCKLPLSFPTVGNIAFLASEIELV